MAEKKPLWSILLKIFEKCSTFFKLFECKIFVMTIFKIYILD